jgi:Fe-Mn family superoxide dismutase
MFNLPYKEIPGVITSTSLNQHVKLWHGYEERAQATGAPYDVAGALLHDFYFKQLTDQPMLIGGPGPRFEQVVGAHWGSVVAWWSAMRLGAIGARGWAITAIRGDDLRIFSFDAHDDGVIGYEPIVVVDCYEHAYFTDYGTRKDLYVDALLKAFDWREIDRRLDLKDCGER